MTVRRVAGLLVEAALAVSVQSLPPPAGSVWVRHDWMPHVLAWLTVDTALRDGPWAGAGFGLLVGWATDLLAGRTLGTAAVAWLACGYGIGLLGRQVFRERWEVPAVFVPLGTLGGITLEMLFVQLWAGLRFLPGLWIRYALPATLINGVLAALAYGAAGRWLWRFTGPAVASWRTPVAAPASRERESETDW